MRRPSSELVEATTTRTVLWHVIYTKPVCERMVVEQLDAKAIDTFLPVRRPMSHHRRLAMPVPKPVFARYVFAALRIGRPGSDLWNLRGEITVLGADSPLVVPPKAMLELFGRVDPQGYMQAPGFKVGDTVMVRRDPFLGFLGQISRLGDKEILIWVAQLSATLRLPIDAVEAA